MWYVLHQKEQIVQDPEFKDLDPGEQNSCIMRNHFINKVSTFVRHIGYNKWKPKFINRFRVEECLKAMKADAETIRMKPERSKECWSIMSTDLIGPYFYAALRGEEPDQNWPISKWKPKKQKPKPKALPIPQQHDNNYYAVPNQTANYPAPDANANRGQGAGIYYYKGAAQQTQQHRSYVSCASQSAAPTSTQQTHQRQSYVLYDSQAAAPTSNQQTQQNDSYSSYDS